jgi:hypothetical protein
MGADLVLMIDDMIVPNKGVHPHSAEQDILMMATFASMGTDAKTMRRSSQIGWLKGFTSRHLY